MSIEEANHFNIYARDLGGIDTVELKTAIEIGMAVLRYCRMRCTHFLHREDQLHLGEGLLGCRVNFEQGRSGVQLCNYAVSLFAFDIGAGCPLEAQQIVHR